MRHFSGSAAEYLAISTTFVKLTMYIQMYMLCKFLLKFNHLNFYFSFVSHCGYRDETGERNEKKRVI